MQETIGSYRREGEAFKRRLKLFSYIVVLASFLLILRIGFMQFLEGEKYRNLSENNRIRIKRIPACRGMILDRRGEVLVDNKPSFTLYFVAEDAGDVKGTVRMIGDLTGIDPLLLEGRINETRDVEKIPPFIPIKLIEGLSWDMVAKLEVNKVYLPGVIVDVFPRRYYPHGAFAAHLFGHMGEVSRKELRDNKLKGYRPGDLIGKTDLERRFEGYLRGIDGGKQVEVDAEGRELTILGEVPSIPGKNLVLTIDAGLQRVAEEALGSQNGAIVAGNPNTGEILAMTSHPSFDPNEFVSRIDRNRWNELVNHPFNPLENRAIKGQYPPGSTFKIVVAAAALEEGLIRPETPLYCPGSFTLGNRSYRCWRKEGHGWVNLHQALVQSCDVYFYQLGLRLGIDRLARYARAFGMGRATGFDPEREKEGFIPTSTWKIKRLGEPWQTGETLSCAIGQSYVLVTPIQQFVALSALVNGGRIIVPRVVDRIEDNEGRTIHKFDHSSNGRIPVSDENLKYVKEALYGVVNEPQGTGGRARLDGVKIGGKTGTAQVVRLKGDDRRKELTYEERDHAWFIAFAPVEKPELVVVVLVEHGGHGGSAAAPMAKKIFEYYFRSTKTAMRVQ